MSGSTATTILAFMKVDPSTDSRASVACPSMAGSIWMTHKSAPPAVGEGDVVDAYAHGLEPLVEDRLVEQAGQLLVVGERGHHVVAVDERVAHRDRRHLEHGLLVRVGGKEHGGSGRGPVLGRFHGVDEALDDDRRVGRHDEVDGLALDHLAGLSRDRLEELELPPVLVRVRVDAGHLPGRVGADHDGLGHGRVGGSVLGQDPVGGRGDERGHHPVRAEHARARVHLVERARCRDRGGWRSWSCTDTGRSAVWRRPAARPGPRRPCAITWAWQAASSTIRRGGVRGASTSTRRGTTSVGSHPRTRPCAARLTNSWSTRRHPANPAMSSKTIGALACAVSAPDLVERDLLVHVDVVVPVLGEEGSEIESSGDGGQVGGDHSLPPLHRIRLAPHGTAACT